MFKDARHTFIVLRNQKIQVLMVIVTIDAQMVVMISVVLVKQLKRSHFSELKKKPNLLVG